MSELRGSLAVKVYPTLPYPEQFQPLDFDAKPPVLGRGMCILLQSQFVVVARDIIIP